VPCLASRRSPRFVPLLALLAACSSEAEEKQLAARAAQESVKVERELGEFVALTRSGLARHAPALAPSLEQPVGDPRRRMAFPLIKKLRTATASRGENDFDLLTAGLLFTAVLDEEGKFVVRDEGPEKMYREDLRGRFSAVGEALAGRAACSSGLVPGNDYAVALVAVPIQKDGRTLGAFIGVASFPSLARRAERLRSQSAQGVDGGVAAAPTVRVAMFWRNKVHPGSIQPELDPTLPRLAVRRSKLAKAPFFSQFVNVQQRGFGMTVRRVPALGEDAGVIVWRAEPIKS
jgi:hypothetical protein